MYRSRDREKLNKQTPKYAVYLVKVAGKLKKHITRRERGYLIEFYKIVYGVEEVK